MRHLARWLALMTPEADTAFIIDLKSMTVRLSLKHRTRILLGMIETLMQIAFCFRENDGRVFVREKN